MTVQVVLPFNPATEVLDEWEVIGEAAEETPRPLPRTLAAIRDRLVSRLSSRLALLPGVKPRAVRMP